MARSVDYKLGEYAFPRGWFVVAESAEVGRKPCNVHYFGQDLVLYRGESGRVVMLDAYCPHMGTHLGMSTMSATVQSDTFLEGDSIRCPFHAWRFGPDGKCNHIP
jgi:3-ketosteroid 9alpha-monooxygenase subunit A